MCVGQVLEEEEYEVWMKSQLFAESSIENREELLLDSAQRLETNLTLLGRRADVLYSYVHTELGGNGTQGFFSSVFRHHWNR